MEKTQKEIQDFFKEKQRLQETLQPRPQMILNDLSLEEMARIQTEKEKLKTKTNGRN